MSQIIEVIVSQTGDTMIETKGFAGAACREASRFLEAALGRQTGERLTSEYHETSIAPRHLAQEG